MAKRKKKSTTSKKTKKTVRQQNASTRTTRGGTRNRKGGVSDNDTLSSIPDIPDFDSFPEPSSSGRSIRKLPKPDLSNLPQPTQAIRPEIQEAELQKAEHQIRVQSTPQSTHSRVCAYSSDPTHHLGPLLHQPRAYHRQCDRLYVVTLWLGHAGITSRDDRLGDLARLMGA